MGGVGSYYYFPNAQKVWKTGFGAPFAHLPLHNP
jgi:hypothetical protein